MTEISLEITSVIDMLKNLASTKFVGFIRIKESEKPGAYIWIDNNQFLGVSGVSPNTIKKLRAYKIVDNKQLLENIERENKNLIQPLGKKLKSVYNVSEQNLDRLFEEQIAEVYQRIGLTEGVINAKQCSRQDFHWSELTGRSISFSKLIVTCLEQNFANRYRSGLPTSEETITTTNKDNRISEVEHGNYRKILNLADKDLTIKQIAKRTNSSLVDIQKSIYILVTLGLVETSLTSEGILKYSQLLFSKGQTSSKRIKISKKSNLIAPAVAIAIVNLLTVAGTILGIFSNIELFLLDRHFKLRGTEQNEDITLVTVDEKDIARIGKYPIPDRLMARVLDNLNQHGPAVIGIDIYRDIPAPPGNQELLAAFEKYENVVGVEKIGQISGPPVLTDYGMVGFSDQVLEADGVLRRALISTTIDGETKVGLGTFLAVYVLSDTENALSQEEDRYLLSGKPLPYLDKNSGGFWQTKILGLQIMLDYQHRDEDFTTISLSDVIENKIDPEDVKDKVIIIGVTAESKKDFFYSPFSRSGNQSIPQSGMVSHANITAQLLDLVREDRKILRPQSKQWEISYIVIWSLIGIALGAVAVEVKLKSNANRGLTLLAQISALGLMTYGGGYLAFLWGRWIPIVAPALNSMISSLLMDLQYENQIKQVLYLDKQIDTYNRYYLDKNLQQLLENDKKDKIGLIFCRFDPSTKPEFNTSNTIAERHKFIRQTAKLIETHVTAGAENNFVARHSENTLAIVIESTNINKLEQLAHTIEGIGKNQKSAKKYRIQVARAMSSDLIDSGAALYIKVAEKLEA